MTITNRLKYYYEQFARTGEPVVPSIQALLGLFTKKSLDLEGFFNLNVHRAEAAKTYLKLFLDNNIDAIVMPPAAHSAVPHDTWATISYTGLWNYLDYPAVVIPVDHVRDFDVVDDLSHAKYGPEDERVYNLCTYLTTTPTTWISVANIFFPRYGPRDV